MPGPSTVACPAAASSQALGNGCTSKFRWHPIRPALQLLADHVAPSLPLLQEDPNPEARTSQVFSTTNPPSQSNVAAILILVFAVVPQSVSLTFASLSVPKSTAPKVVIYAPPRPLVTVQSSEIQKVNLLPPLFCSSVIPSSPQLRLFPVDAAALVRGCAAALIHLFGFLLRQLSLSAICNRRQPRPGIPAPKNLPPEAPSVT